MITVSSILQFIYPPHHQEGGIPACYYILYKSFCLRNIYAQHLHLLSFDTIPRLKITHAFATFIGNYIGGPKASGWEFSWSWKILRLRLYQKPVYFIEVKSWYFVEVIWKASYWEFIIILPFKCTKNNFFFYRLWNQYILVGFFFYYRKLVFC